MLARSAYDAGFNVAVIDQYGDQDTHRYAQVVKTLSEFSDALIFRNIEQLFLTFPFEGIILASGFESRTDLVAELEQRWIIFGPSAASISFAKQPLHLAKLLTDNDISFPITQLEAPQSDQWLVKEKGGSGGDHVEWFNRQEKYSEDSYYQKFQSGVTGSVLFLATFEDAQIVGYSRTWSVGEHSFRYSGAVGWNNIEQQAELARVVKTISRLFKLVGLCGIDFILDDQGGIHILEINPRPVSTMDLHDNNPLNLFKAHLNACHQNLENFVLDQAIYYAKTILYADRDLSINIRKWPKWVADMPQYDENIEMGAPICTVYAEASGANHARKLVHDREIKIKELLGLL